MKKTQKVKLTDSQINESFAQFHSNQVLSVTSMLKIKGGDGEADGGEDIIPPPPPPPDEG